MAEDLVSRLRSALLYHKVSLEPVPVPDSNTVYTDDPNDPTLSYISTMLFQEDEQQDDSQQVPEFLDSYHKLMTELNILISPPSPNDHFTQAPTAELDAFLYSELMDCARSVAANRGSDVHRLAGEIRSTIASMSTSVSVTARQRVLLWFVDALVARHSGFGPQIYKAMCKGLVERQAVHVRFLSFPFSRITYRFANNNILHLCMNTSSKRVHIVDYGIHYGCQWPNFIHWLGQRMQERSPKLKITGVDKPGTDLGQIGRNLVEFAKSCGVSLEFEAVISSSWELVQPHVHVNEVLVVNCNLRLRHLREDGSVVDNPRKLFFERIYRLKPELFITCVLHANTNMSSPFFIHRFEETLNDASEKLDYFEALLMPERPEEFNLMQSILAKNVMNMVACEGLDRVERPSSYRSWDARARRAGFEPMPVRPEAFDLVKKSWHGFEYNGNFRIGLDDNWLLAGWKELIIYGMSTWRPKTI